MSEPVYRVEYAQNIRAKCKGSGCAKPFVQEELRITKTTPYGEKKSTAYYHPNPCFWVHMQR